MAGFLHPDIISAIQGYDLRARRVVEGFLVGIHKSPFIGAGMEFRQHREYVQGDDLRHLDWKVYAKTDRFFIRQFESETNLGCQIMLDCSESMMFKGDAPMSKFEYAATAAASLAYLILQQRDAVGFTLFDDKVISHLPAKATYSQFHHAMHLLENLTPSAKTMTGAALMNVGNSLKRRSAIVLLSDFVDDIEPIRMGLNRLSFDGHDVMAVNVADPFEVSFPYSGPAILDGMEESGELKCDPSDYRKLYLESRERHYTELRAACRRLRFDFSDLVTSTPLDEALAGLLLERMQTATR